MEMSKDIQVGLFAEIFVKIWKYLWKYILTVLFFNRTTLTPSYDCTGASRFMNDVISLPSINRDVHNSM